MCGRFDLIATPKEIKDAFNLNTDLDFKPSYNIAPSQQVLAIFADENNQRQPVWLQWGLIPSWAKDTKIGHSLINARAETITEKPSFRTAFKKRRALILATGFYEWHQTEQGKQPYRITHENKVFAFAGLWEHWDKEGQSIFSCTIITTAANDLLAPIHYRMPVILKPESYQPWLSILTKPDELLNLIEVDGYDSFTCYPVSSHVNSPRHNDESCIRQARHYFSRKLKWDPSDFSGEKPRGG